MIGVYAHSLLTMSVVIHAAWGYVCGDRNRVSYQSEQQGEKRNDFVGPSFAVDLFQLGLY